MSGNDIRSAVAMQCTSTLSTRGLLRFCTKDSGHSGDHRGGSAQWNESGRVPVTEPDPYDARWAGVVAGCLENRDRVTLKTCSAPLRHRERGAYLVRRYRGELVRTKLGELVLAHITGE